MTLHTYENIYVKTNFERLELFKSIRELLHPRTVLYPGCSVHITPSFVFQNVTYVDSSDQSREFFKDLNPIKDYVSRHTDYRSDPYIQYLCSDIRHLDSSFHAIFNLVITAYSGAIGRYCWKYLSKKGHYISNNHDGDIESLLSLPDAKFQGYFEKERWKYQFIQTDDPESIQTTPVSYRGDKQGNIAYLGNDRYYLVKKV